MAEKINKFWMVFRAGSWGCKFQHPTREAAETEAERLSRANPGSEFVVLEAVGVVSRSVSEPNWDRALLTQRDIMQAQADVSRKSFSFESASAAGEFIKHEVEQGKTPPGFKIHVRTPKDILDESADKILKACGLFNEGVNGIRRASAVLEEEREGIPF